MSNLMQAPKGFVNHNGLFIPANTFSDDRLEKRISEVEKAARAYEVEHGSLPVDTSELGITHHFAGVGYDRRKTPRQRTPAGQETLPKPAEDNPQDYEKKQGLLEKLRTSTVGKAVAAIAIGMTAGLAMMPATASAQPTLNMIGGANGAHLYFDNLEPGLPTTVCMVPEPHAQPTLADVVRILEPGVNYVEIENNWQNKRDDATGACWYVVTQLVGGDSGQQSNRLGRAIPIFTFNHPLTDDPNINPTFENDFAMFTAGLDTIVLVKNLSGSVAYPFGQHILDPYNRIHDIQVVGSLTDQNLYWNWLNIQDRVVTGSPKNNGFAGFGSFSLLNSYGTSASKNITFMVSPPPKIVQGMLTNVLSDEPIENLIVELTTKGWPDGVVYRDTTNPYGEYVLGNVLADSVYMKILEFAGENDFLTYSDTLGLAEAAKTKNVRFFRFSDYPEAQSHADSLLWLKDIIDNSLSIQDSIGIYYGFNGGTTHPERIAFVDSLINRIEQEIGAVGAQGTPVPENMFYTSMTSFPQNQNITGINISWKDYWSCTPRGPPYGWLLGGTTVFDSTSVHLNPPTGEGAYINGVHELGDFMGHRDTPTGAIFEGYNKFPYSYVWLHPLEKLLIKLRFKYKTDPDWRNGDIQIDGNYHGNFSYP